MDAPREILAKVCSFPKSDASIWDALRNLGWEDIRASLTVDSLAAYLRANPTAIDDWTRWSDDKRTSGGFYLMDPTRAVGWWGHRTWTIGRLLEPHGHEDWDFPDGPTACAEYILRELDFWYNLR